MTVGERIKEKRIELGMSQDELAKKAGYKSRSSINKIELARDLPLNKVELVARALDCSPQYLMGWDETIENQANIAADMITDPTLTEYVGKILALDEKSRAQIYSLIDLLLTK